MTLDLIPDEKALEEAANVLDDTGVYHGWFEKFDFENDPIGKDEFLALTWTIIKAYLEIASKQIHRIDTVEDLVRCFGDPACAHYSVPDEGATLRAAYEYLGWKLPKHALPRPADLKRVDAAELLVAEEEAEETKSKTGRRIEVSAEEILRNNPELVELYEIATAQLEAERNKKD